MKVPPCNEMEEAFEKMIQESFKAGGKAYKKKTGGHVAMAGDALCW